MSPPVLLLKTVRLLETLEYAKENRQEMAKTCIGFCQVLYINIRIKSAKLNVAIIKEL